MSEAVLLFTGKASDLSILPSLLAPYPPIKMIAFSFQFKNLFKKEIIVNIYAIQTLTRKMYKSLEIPLLMF